MITTCIFVPVADVEAVNLALDEAGYGPRNLSVPMRGNVRVEDPDQATHYGCNWNMQDELPTVLAIVKEASPTARILSTTTLEGVETIDRGGTEFFEEQAGTHFYIPVDPRLAEGFTRGLYQLINQGKDGEYARIIQHKDPSYWPVLELRENDVIPISMKANVEPLSQVLQAFVDGGGITKKELATILGGIQMMAGREVRVRDFIPASWQRYVLDKEHLVLLGYLS